MSVQVKIQVGFANIKLSKITTYKICIAWSVFTHRLTGLTNIKYCSNYIFSYMQVYTELLNY